MKPKKRTADETIKNVTATLGFEGLKSSDLAIDLSRKIVEGSISSSEARKAIYAKYGLQGK